MRNPNNTLLLTCAILSITFTSCAIHVNTRNDDRLLRKEIEPEQPTGKFEVQVSHQFEDGKILFAVKRTNECKFVHVQHVDRTEVTERKAGGWMWANYAMAGVAAAIGGGALGWSTTLPENPQKDLITGVTPLSREEMAYTGYFFLGLTALPLALGIVDSVRALDSEKHIGKVRIVESKKYAVCKKPGSLEGLQVVLDTGLFDMKAYKLSDNHRSVHLTAPVLEDGSATFALDFAKLPRFKYKDLKKLGYVVEKTANSSRGKPHAIGTIAILEDQTLRDRAWWHSCRWKARNEQLKCLKEYNELFPDGESKDQASQKQVELIVQNYDEVWSDALAGCQAPKSSMHCQPLQKLVQQCQSMDKKLSALMCSQDKIARGNHALSNGPALIQIADEQYWRSANSGLCTSYRFLTSPEKTQAVLNKLTSIGGGGKAVEGMVKKEVKEACGGLDDYTKKFPQGRYIGTANKIVSSLKNRLRQDYTLLKTRADHATHALNQICNCCNVECKVPCAGQFNPSKCMEACCQVSCARKYPKAAVGNWWGKCAVKGMMQGFKELGDALDMARSLGQPQ